MIKIIGKYMEERRLWRLVKYYQRKAYEERAILSGASQSLTATLIKLINHYEVEEARAIERIKNI